MLQVLDADTFAEFESRAIPDEAAFGACYVTGLTQEDALCVRYACSPPRAIMMDFQQRMDVGVESVSFCSRHGRAMAHRCMQSHQEIVLNKQAARWTSALIAYEHKLSSFREEADTVLCRIVNAVDEERAYDVQTRYLVGCDGPSSRVAEGMQVHFDGFLNMNKARSILIRSETLRNRLLAKHGTAHQYQILRKTYGAGLLVPSHLGECLFNFSCQNKAALALPPHDVVKEFSGLQDGDFQAKPGRHWYWNFFLARNFFNSNRIFLCGDACHSWPPMGGLGGNSGYADAFNLGWKLALTVRGQGGRVFLESYSYEQRHRTILVGLSVLGWVGNPERTQILSRPIFAHPKLRHWIGCIFSFANSGHHSANSWSQTGIQYGVKFGHSPIISPEPERSSDDSPCNYVPVIAAGARLPHMFVDGRSIHERISMDTYTFLVLSRSEVGVIPSSVLNCLWRLTELNVPSVTVVINLDNATPPEIRQLYVEEQVVIVRPDFWVAWRLPVGRRVPVEAELVALAETLTGRTANGECLWPKMVKSKAFARTVNYHRWLHSVLENKMRPLGFFFPRAVRVAACTKAEAVAAVKARTGNQGFSATSKVAASATVDSTTN